MFEIEKPSPKFKKNDNRKFEEYADEDKKKMKKQLEEGCGFSVALLLAAAANHGFKPTTLEQSRQKQADAACIHMMNIFCSGPYSSITSMLSMDSTLDNSYKNKPKF